MTLVEFDELAAYELDGHTTAVAWLVERCGMGRSTAAEKLRLARELHRRPAVNSALLAGTLTYSKARAFTRLVGLDDERDAALIAEFADETADTIERMVRWWNLRNGDPDGPKPDPYDVPRIKYQPGFGGANGRIIIEGPNEDLARAMNLFDAYGSYLFFNASSVKTSHDVSSVETDGHVSSVKTEEPLSSVKTTVLRADDASAPVESLAEARGDTGYREVWDPEKADDVTDVVLSLNQRRYEWFFDLIEEIALVHDDEVDPDRAAVAVTVPYESLAGNPKLGVGVLDAGPLIVGEALRRVCCDAGITRIVVRGASEILDTGRQTRTWNRAQRRAIRHRHGNRCAIKGCDRRITEIHHLVFWENGGKTCIENGIPLCSRHHHMVHDLGWTITWDPMTGVTAFTGPQQQVLHSEVDPFLVRPPALAA